MRRAVVIPAKAGIQKIQNWIPIFMGMTDTGLQSLPSRATRDKSVACHAFRVVSSLSSVLRLVAAFQFDRDRAVVDDFHRHHGLELAGNHPFRTQDTA